MLYTLAKTIRQICQEDYIVTDGNGQPLLELKKGKEYIISWPDEAGIVVYSSIWTRVPERIFFDFVSKE